MSGRNGRAVYYASLLHPTVIQEDYRAEAALLQWFGGHLRSEYHAGQINGPPALRAGGQGAGINILVPHLLNLSLMKPRLLYPLDIWR